MRNYKTLWEDFMKQRLLKFFVSVLSILPLYSFSSQDLHGEGQIPQSPQGSYGLYLGEVTFQTFRNQISGINFSDTFWIDIFDYSITENYHRVTIPTPQENPHKRDQIISFVFLAPPNIESFHVSLTEDDLFFDDQLSSRKIVSGISEKYSPGKCRSSHDSKQYCSVEIKIKEMAICHGYEQCYSQLENLDPDTKRGP